MGAPELPTFERPEQLLNFSYEPRINAALENEDETNEIWRAMDDGMDMDSDASDESMRSNEGASVKDHAEEHDEDDME